MIGTVSKRNSFIVAAIGICLTGMTCPGRPSLLPFASITAVQLFDQPNHTMALSVESAVLDASAIAKVNWVFGDGSGFVEGPANRATIQHVYASPGDYEVTAYLFDAQGLVDQLTSVITVVPNGDGSGTDPVPGEDELPTKATGPNPADGSEDVAVDVELSWIAGLDATSHDVYFGTDETAVSDADSDDAANFKGNQEETTFDPGDLAADTEYFWRVDEVNSLGTTKGGVFSFTTGRLPGTVKSPVPADGSTSARVDQVIRWTAGANTTSHDVYFGKSMTQVADATPDDDDVFQGNQTATSFDPEDEAATDDGDLLANTTYYWRIDEVGPGGTATGPVFQFTTASVPAKVMTPAPADGATDVDVNQVLSWTAAPGIESYDVYFGTDKVEVEAADRSALEYAGNRTTKTFDPAIIGGTTYFWRIDTLGPGGTTTGDVFEFTTADPPGQVLSPFQPAHTATNVDIETDFAWNAGVGGLTTSYTTYLSTNASAVTSGAGSALLQTQDASSTMIDRDAADALAPNTQYFWRVDASGPGGTTTGPVLSFTTGGVPLAVTTPTPPIGQRGVALSPMLSWLASVNANDYLVYLGDDEAAVESADQQDAVFQGSVNVTNFAPAELEGNTEYFWRVDARGVGGVAEGAVWRFTTAPARADNPMPTQNQMNVALNAALTWTAGSGAMSHDVYLGTDETAVTGATNASAEFQVNQIGTTFTPALPLAGNTTYYWRIDEVGAFGTTKGRVWTFKTGAGQATEISPADGDTLVPLMPTLQWTPGDGAMSHDVYLGTSEDAVENAGTGSPEYQARRNLPNFTPGARLAGSTTHFWRIDSVTADGLVTRGEVWQFRTRPGAASDPSPMNFAMDVATNALLMWTADAEALRFEVYVGTNMTDVMNAGSGAVPAGVTLIDTDQTTVDPGDFAADATVFWRVDTIAVDDLTVTRGTVWRFTVIGAPAQATGPSPFNGAVDASQSPTLTWSASDGAATYDVYFGTNMANVLNATTADTEFQGNQASRSFAPGMLSANTTYYWRIDAKNSAGTTKGAVWSFTTGN